MIRRRTFLLVVATLLGGALVSAPPYGAVHAQDAGGEGKKKEKDEEEEKTPEEKELEAIGKEFADKDVDALIARVPEDVGEGKEGKVRLRLGQYDDTYKRTQAKKVLEEWLESRTITKVKLKSTKELVGTFTLKYRRRGRERETERTLQIRIARAGDDGFVLKEIEVQQQ